MKTIVVEVQGGAVVDVHGMPEAYEYAVADHDEMEPAIVEEVIKSADKGNYEALADSFGSAMRDLRGRVYVYDNGGQTVDRYTIAILNDEGKVDVYGMSSDPSSPDGFNQFSHTAESMPEFEGRRVYLEELPSIVFGAILDRA